jgi:hypothetical protein
MKKLYLNIVWPGILIGLLIPFSGKISSFRQAFAEKPVTDQAAALAKEPTPESSAALTETTEFVCGELLFEPDNSQGILRLPAFDPSKGLLTGVEITTEGTLLADIYRKNLQHNDYHAMFSADLKGDFPGGLQLSHTAKLSYQAAMSSVRQMQYGIEAFVDETTTKTEEVTESLEQFYGTGNLDIPLEVVNLIGLKAENFNYHTQLKAKVCIDYIYEKN